MAKLDEFLDRAGLAILWNKITGKLNEKADITSIPTKVSDLTNDSNYVAKTDAATSAPLMNGEAAVGKSELYAREDHKHPSDSTKVDKVDGKGLSTNDYTTEEKNKLAAFGNASEYALKTDITGLYKYMGSVPTFDDLPTEGNEVGHVWDVKADGMNYAYTDEGTWDNLGAIFTINPIKADDINTICV